MLLYNQNTTSPRVVGTLHNEGENLIWTYMNKRICSKCGEEKPFSEYHSKRGKSQPECKPCRSKYMAKLYQDNRERERAVRKAWYEKNKILVCEKLRKNRQDNLQEHRLRARLRRKGMSLEQYQSKIIAQRNSCEICLGSFGTDAYKCSYIDHDHKTGKIRGLLCSQCNTALGLLREDIKLFQKCVAYLKKYKK